VEKAHTKHSIWEFPWGYTEGFIIAIGLLIIGILLQLYTGSVPNFPKWPFSLIIGLVLIFILLIIHLQRRKIIFIQWLSSVPCSISAIVLFTLLSLYMGLVPQDFIDNHIFLSRLGNITHSWMFLLSTIYLLCSLGLVTLKKVLPFNTKNLGFLFSHAGLWIIIFSAGIGSSDLLKLQVTAFTGKETSQGLDLNGIIYNLPFKIKLQKFFIEEYPAKLFLFDKSTETIYNNPILLEQGKTLNMGVFKISIRQYLPTASIKDSVFVATSPDDKYAMPVSFITIADKSNKILSKGWITCGNQFYKPAFLSVDNSIIAGMAKPEAKRYVSTVDIIDKSSKNWHTTIEVNKPFHIDNWDLYQVSYDDKAGRFSAYSVFEAVRDPWLPIIYVGVFLVMAGSVFMFWNGVKQK
jgi:hypothetical protein